MIKAMAVENRIRFAIFFILRSPICRGTWDRNHCIEKTRMEDFQRIDTPNANVHNGSEAQLCDMLLEYLGNSYDGWSFQFHVIRRYLHAQHSWKAWREKAPHPDERIQS